MFPTVSDKSQLAKKTFWQLVVNEKKAIAGLLDKRFFPNKIREKIPKRSKNERSGCCYYFCLCNDQPNKKRRNGKLCVEHFILLCRGYVGKLAFDFIIMKPSSLISESGVFGKCQLFEDRRNVVCKKRLRKFLKLLQTLPLKGLAYACIYFTKEL
jgi:hypothetical protein